MSDEEKVVSGGDKVAWGRRLVEDKRWLLHVPTLVIGVAEELYDGVEKVYESPMNGLPVTAPVLRLATGHALLVDPTAFVELEDREVAFYVMAVERMGEFLLGTAKIAANMSIPEATAMTLLSSLLRAHLVAIEKRGST